MYNLTITTKFVHGQVAVATCGPPG